MSSPGPLIVFVDANVLYSRTLRDWLGLIQLERLPPIYAVLWSEDVLAEVIYHLRRQHPTWDGRTITRVRDLIAGTFQDGRVENFRIDGSYSGPDPLDQHVHAAATACGADYLLTVNTDDFSGEPASPYEVVHPDSFFCLVDDAAADAVRRVVRRQMAYWSGQREESLLPEYLIRAGCPLFAERIHRHQGVIGRLPGRRPNRPRA